MSNMTVEVDFLAGTTIQQAITEAQRKAIIWDVAYVCFNFNGIKMSVGKNCDIQKSVDAFHKTMKGGTPFKFVVANN